MFNSGREKGGHQEHEILAVRLFLTCRKFSYSVDIFQNSCAKAVAVTWDLDDVCLVMQPALRGAPQRSVWGPVIFTTC